ncbi:EAL domain-containing protein [Pseudalkalibacillus caeni]|uniref:EAL domain-containing protein n=1 Tax=Exobacillus caeni TaxID=2574798 RepID=A0A5R9F598_9BACL|nr:EAL domain-containing protein [Pseudalkalibacillus caeni]TLS37516.1 EAL domain-containing protein [Pseudalkalibacillus caeni]
MNGCSNCLAAVEIYEPGILSLVSKVPEIHFAIKEIVSNTRENESENEGVIQFTYETKKELFLLLKEIVSNMNLISQQTVLTSIDPAEIGTTRINRMILVNELFERVSHPNYLKIINDSLVTNHMQPIIALDGETIYGYEFLLRPANEAYPFKPYELFEMAQKSGLQAMLDSRARISSIKVSSEYLPKGVKRFINFLPSSIYDPAHCLKSTFEAVKQYDVDPNDIVFEVVETEKILDVGHLQRIFQAYQEKGIKVALDDVGAGYSTNEILARLNPDFAKIDRGLISFCDIDREKQAKIEDICSIAIQHNITLLAEGIERKGEVDYLREAGIPLAQGYYFGKPREEPIRELIL